MRPYGVGVRSDTPIIQGVIRHEVTGLLVEPDTGVIYGTRGEPVGAVCGDGYVRLGGKRTHGPRHQYAHRVVWESVNGPIPVGLEIDHLSGVKTDNRIGNLEAVTKSQNILRAIALGLAPVGEGKAQAKLTDELVREIRATVGSVSTREWARRLGLDAKTVRLARDGTTWRHVACKGRAKPAQRRVHMRRKTRGPK